MYSVLVGSYVGWLGLLCLDYGGRRSIGGSIVDSVWLINLWMSDISLHWGYPFGAANMGYSSVRLILLCVVDSMVHKNTTYAWLLMWRYM